MEKTKLTPDNTHSRTPRREQLTNLARILNIPYTDVLKLEPQIELATNWDKNHDFLLIEICGDPPKDLMHKIGKHIVDHKYIHLQYGVLDSTGREAQ